MRRCKGDKSAPPTPAGPAPVVPRTEATAFGTYRIVPDTTPAPLAADQLTQAQFVRLQTAWTRVNDNSRGLKINGSGGDKSTLIAIFGREIGRSPTFRALIIEITEDAAHPVTLEVGRDNASWLDAFATNAVDLNDLEWLDVDPPADYPWAFTRGEDIVHWLAERRHAAVHAAGFPAAHAFPMGAGGLQEQYRRDLGQPGRIISQVLVPGAGGLQEGQYSDGAGNMMIIRRDASAGDPVVYEFEYKPAAPSAAAPGRTRINTMRATVTATATAAGAAAPGPIYARFVSGAASVDVPAQAVALGGNVTFSLPLGRIVPTGGPITMQIRQRGTGGADTLLLSVPWPHPFGPANGSATVANVRLDVNARLEKT